MGSPDDGCTPCRAGFADGSALVVPHERALDRNAHRCLAHDSSGTPVDATEFRRTDEVFGGRDTTPLLPCAQSRPGWAPECVLTVASVGFERFSARLPPIPPGGQAEATVERMAVGRGETDGHDVALTWSDWMGLRRLCAHVTARKALIVHPGVVSRTVPRFAGGDGESVGTRIDRTGSQVFGVREWRSGDPARHIHWRSTARRGQLVVVEYEIPVGEALTFLVIGDGRVRMSEAQVTTLASLAVAAKRAGHVVTLGARQAGLHPLTGGTSVDVLDWCARLDVPTLPSPELVGELFQGFGAGGQVLLAASGDIPGCVVDAG